MKYDKHHINLIIKSLQNGDGRVNACKKANIHYSTFLDWIENKPEFSEAIKKAEMTGNDKIKDICKRKIIEDKSWQSGAWWLERNFPDEYKERKNVDGELKQEINIIVDSKKTGDIFKQLKDASKTD